MENAVSGHVEEALQDPVGAENGFETSKSFVALTKGGGLDAEQIL